MVRSRHERARGAFSVALAAVALCGPVWAADVTLQGTGATFPAPLYQRWFTEFNKVHPEVQINYQALGSGAGVKQFQDGLVNFGASDAAMTDEEIAAVKDGVVLLPMTAGSIVLAYNLPGAPAELKLSREAYAGIFLGKITRWNDPKIASANPGVTLPDTKITAGHALRRQRHHLRVHPAPERDQRRVEERPRNRQVGELPGRRRRQGQPRRHRADQADARRDRLRRVRLREADADADGDPREQERHVRQGRCGRARRPRSPASSCRPTCGRGSRIPTAATRIRSSPTPGCSATRSTPTPKIGDALKAVDPLRPDRRAEVQRGARLHPASRRTSSPRSPRRSTRSS